MRELYQNQAVSAMLFFASAGEHITGVTSINSVTASASKDGGAFALITATASAERGVGWYNFTLNSGWTDTLGDLVLNVSAASSDPVDVKFNVISGLVSAVHATATQVSDKSNYFLDATSLTGVTATLVSDKTGYSILSTNLTGVTAAQVTDKTGYSILATNLTGVTAALATASYITDATYLGGQGLTATFIHASGSNTVLTGPSATYNNRVNEYLNIATTYVSARLLSGEGWPTEHFGGITLYGTDILYADDWANNIGTIDKDGSWADGAQQGSVAGKFLAIDINAGGLSEVPVSGDLVIHLQGSMDGANWATLNSYNLKGQDRIGQDGGYLRVDGGMWYPWASQQASRSCNPFAAGERYAQTRLDVAMSSRMAATASITAATATQITDATFLGGQGLTATYSKANTASVNATGAYTELTSGTYKLSTLATTAVQQQISATATDIKDFLGGTFTVDPVASAASALRMDGTTLLKAWTLSAATFASAVPAFIKRTI